MKSNQSIGLTCGRYSYSVKDWTTDLPKDQLVKCPRELGTRVARKLGPQQTRVNRAAWIIGKYLTAFKTSPNESRIKQHLGALFDHIVEENHEACRQEEQTAYGAYPFSDEAVGLVVEALAVLGPTTKLMQAVNCVEERLPPHTIKVLFDLGPALRIEA